MSESEVMDALPVVEARQACFAEATPYLQEAIDLGCQDAAVRHALATAYKRQNKLDKSRLVLSAIREPDAEVYLQLGILSLLERQYVQAEQDLSRAWHLDATRYAIGFNLLRTRLTLGRIEDCANLAPQVAELAPSPEQRRILLLLGDWLAACTGPNPLSAKALHAPDWRPEEERYLLNLIRGVGQVDVMVPLLQVLADARPESLPVQEVFLEAVLVKAKALLDRSDWAAAEDLLRSVAPATHLGRNLLAAWHNLLGCCLCLNQDVSAGLKQFQNAVKCSPGDARIHQNLAVVQEILFGDLSKAEPHWTGYLDLLDQRLPVPPHYPNYLERLQYECLNRLSGRFAEKEKWSSALVYVQRALHLRPDDTDMLERLFHLFNQVKRSKDARATLTKLRALHPGEPQYELFELDLIEVKGLAEMEKLLTEIDKVLKRHPNDARVQDRAVGMVGNVIPFMASLCNQLTEQLDKVVDQVRRLPNYQVNWSAVQEVMHDLQREFHKLRRITNKCLPLVNSEDQRHWVRDLADHIDRKIEVCRSMGA